MPSTNSLLCILISSAAMAAAGIPTSLAFGDLASYLPYASTATSLLLNDASANQSLYNSSAKQTVFLPLNIPYQQYLAQGTGPGAAGQVIANNLKNSGLEAALLDFIRLPGSISSSQFYTGTYLYSSFLTNPQYNRVPNGAHLDVYKSPTQFYIQTGIAFKANIVIADIPFNNGLVHVVDNVVAPPYNLHDTGVVLGLPLLVNLTTDLPALSNPASAPPPATVFAIANGGTYEFTSLAGEYVLIDTVLYSTGFKNGMTLTTASGLVLQFSQDPSSGNFSVNRIPIIRTDIIVQEGVVHVLQTNYQ